MKKKSLNTTLLLALFPALMLLGNHGEAQATVIDYFKYTGSIVTYHVTTTGTYDITAYGGRGGGGGNGAEIGGDFSLTSGKVLQILAGGGGFGGGGGNGGGGGGGSFVALGNSYKNATALVVAGGGGGDSFNSGCGGGGCGVNHISPGYINPSGGGEGGYSGFAGGGGGFVGNGDGFNNGGGSSFNSGGDGGGGGNGASNGGFGGGGGGNGSYGGGGGGYSGGPGSNDVEYSGGGGSSYFDTVIGSETVVMAGENTNINGLVTLSLISATPSPSSTPEPSTWLLFGTGVGLLGVMAVRKKKELRNTA